MVASKLPNGFVVTVAGRVETMAESNFIVTGLFGLRLEPEITTALPAKPEGLDRVTAGGTMTLIVAEPVLPEASVADIISVLLTATVGMIIVAEKVPDVVVVRSGPGGSLGSISESNFKVTGLFAENPVPVSCTGTPGGPEVLDSVIDGSGILNISDAVKMPSVADIVCCPVDAVNGMLIVVENVPTPDDSKLAGMVDMSVLSNFILIFLLAPKFEPDKRT